MPESAADIQVVFRSVLEQQSDAEIGRKAHGGNNHDPAAIDGDRLQQPLEADEGNAERGQQQNERVEKRSNDAGAMVAEGSRFTGRPPG